MQLLGILLAIFIAWDLFSDASPFPLDSSHVVAYRLGRREFGEHGLIVPAHAFLGWPIEQTVDLTDPATASALVHALSARSTYGLLDTLCFEPGMALQFGRGSNEVDVLICLDCDHAQFIHADQSPMLNLNPLGTWRLKRLYDRIFGPALAGDASTDKTAAGTQPSP